MMQSLFVLGDFGTFFRKSTNLNLYRFGNLAHILYSLLHCTIIYLHRPAGRQGST